MDELDEKSSSKDSPCSMQKQNIYYGCINFVAVAFINKKFLIAPLVNKEHYYRHIYKQKTVMTAFVNKRINCTSIQLVNNTDKE
jgi:hypothetical protein